jgi:hypothetical protein
MAATQTQFEVEAPDAQQKFEIEPPKPKVPQPSFISQAGSALAGRAGIDLTPEEVSSAGSKLGSDLWDMGKGAITGLPKMALRAVGVSDPREDAAHVMEQVQHFEDQGKGPHPYSLPYRVVSPLAENIGVDVRGMEESAKEGDRGGVIGHAAAVPTAMAITEGAARGVPAAIPNVRGALRSPTVGKLAQTAKIGAKASGVFAEELPVIGSVVKGGKVLRQVADVWKSKPPVESPAIDFKNVPFAGEEGVEPRSIPKQANPNAIVYRTRDVGEQGIPHNPRARAQASASMDEVNNRLAPSREGTTGNPQETVGIDLSQVPGFSVRPGPNGPNWIKFHGEASPGVSVPESAISRVGSEAPAISTQHRVNAIGSQVEKSLGGKALEPNVPLREQIPARGTAPEPSNLPEGFSPAESSALKGHKYNPQTREFEVVSSGGQHYVYGDVSPEQAAAFESAESKGKAWNQIRNSNPLTHKVMGGKRVPVKPER